MLNDEDCNSSVESLDDNGFAQEFNSQTSSITPSPVVTTLDRLLGSSQTSSVLSSGSPKSSLPSPALTTLDKLFPTESNSCDHDINYLCSKLEHLSPNDRKKTLSVLIAQIDKNDLKELEEQSINKLSKVFGEYCREKIKHEADNFRYKRSREDGDKTSEEILSKRLNIEQLHIFYEAATGKSGRNVHKN